jgi:uncharacterized membrane protein YtjA (UPF0391 family)
LGDGSGSFLINAPTSSEINMTDTPTPGAAPAAPAQPILVNAQPATDQVEAGFRMTLFAISAVAGALGYTGVAGKASALLMAVSPVAGLIVFVWSQISTRLKSQKAAAMANALPNEVAMTKPGWVK